MRSAGHRVRSPVGHPWHLYPLGALALAIVAVAITQVGPASSSARTSRQTVTAENGVVQSTVTGTGNVEAGTDLSVNFQTGGTLQHVYVTQGQRVYAGQLLAILDPTAADLTLDQAQRSLTAAQDQLDAARIDATTTTTTTAATATVTRTVTAPVTTTTATSTTASRTASRSVPPVRPTQAVRAGAGSNASASSAAASGAGTSGAGTSGAGTSGAGTSGAGTSGAGASGSASAGATTNPVASADSAAASVATARANVDSAQASVRTAEIAVNNTKLYAPVSGTLVSLSSAAPGDTISSGSTSSSGGSSSSATSGSGSTSAGSLGGQSSSGSSGSSASSGTSGSSSSGFAEIVDTGAMTMTVALSESDVTKVHAGQAATVSLDALSGVELAARVSHIATVGTSSNSVVSYDVTLTLAQHDARVRPGMSASATIVTGSAQGVTVPSAAVTGTSSVGSVQMVRNGQTVTQPVVVGVRGTSRTQIVSGVRAGEQLVVVTSLPSLGSSSSAGTSASGTLGGGTSRRLGGFSAGFSGGGGFGAGGGGPPAGP